jgi:quercetin dioxygenase-like cupin family protein
MTTEREPRISEAASAAEWTKMAARVMEDITRSELHRFETNLTASVGTAVSRATATMFRIASAIVGGFFAFDKDQGLSEHTARFDALIQVLDGVAEITIGGMPHRLGKNEMILIPANVPHALNAVERFKMMLVMIRD